MKRVISITLLGLLLLSLSALPFNIKLVRASGTIYIRADGSVDPSTAPISTIDNITYTFTGDITDSIVIERDDIVVDGAGYTVQCTDGYKVILDLSYRSNDTIRNAKIYGCIGGIHLNSSSSNTISGNDIDTGFGCVELFSCFNNTISGNNIKIFETKAGVELFSCFNNTISGNNIRIVDGMGVQLGSSSGNTIIGNIITGGGEVGCVSVALDSSSGNTISKNKLNGRTCFFSSFGNTISENEIGGRIQLDSSSGNMVSENKITPWEFMDPPMGVVLDSSSGNTIVGNIITPYYTFSYGVVLHSSSGNTISKNNITSAYYAVSLSSSSNITVSGNYISGCDYGVYLDSSSNNAVSKNDITNNVYGIFLDFSSDNRFFHNNFINSAVYITPVYANIWDDGYPSGGNYWSDYNGTDLYNGPYQNLIGSDGMGDTPYIIDSSNQDNYPIVYQHGPVRNLDTNLTYLTIQSAIDAKETLNGHTIFAPSGRYYEYVVVNKSLNLMGENEATIIDGNWPYVDGQWCFQILANNVNFTGFTISNSDEGILISESSNCNFYRNKIMGVRSANIRLDHTSDNRILQNNIVGTGSGQGIILLDSSIDNYIFQNRITSHLTGIMLHGYTGTVSYNIITKNSVQGNYEGIRLSHHSDFNVFSENNVTSNLEYGIIVGLEPSNNKFYHNNFVSNIRQVYLSTPGYSNYWDDGYLSGGNYWSDYTGVDLYSSAFQNETGSDGIGDTALIIDPYNKDNYPLTKPYAGLFDIGITNITTSKTVVGQGYSLNITIRILNYGINAETFNLTVYVNTTAIQTQTIILKTRNSTIITFTWNTTGFAKGNCTIWAYAEPVEGETNTNDNTLIDGNVIVTIPGDVDGDFDVDIYDIVKMCAIYGSKKGEPQYDPNCDIAEPYDIINIYDVVTACIHYGEKWP